MLTSGDQVPHRPLMTPRKSKSAGGVVLNTRGEVLVVNQNNNSWSLPKGIIDPGETALEAATREIYEESGITETRLIKELGSYERFRIAEEGGEDKTHLKHITMFLFATEQEELKPVDPANPEARWVSKDEVGALLTHPKDRSFFAEIGYVLKEYA